MTLRLTPIPDGRCRSCGEVLAQRRQARGGKLCSRRDCRLAYDRKRKRRERRGTLVERLQARAAAFRAEADRLDGVVAAILEGRPVAAEPVEEPPFTPEGDPR